VSGLANAMSRVCVCLLVSWCGWFVNAQALNVQTNVRTTECTNHGMHEPRNAQTTECTNHGMYEPLNARTMECTNHGMHDHGMHKPGLLSLLCIVHFSGGSRTCINVGDPCTHRGCHGFIMHPSCLQLEAGLGMGLNQRGPDVSDDPIGPLFGGFEPQ
jgi:hypothetical protein